MTRRTGFKVPRQKMPGERWLLDVCPVMPTTGFTVYLMLDATHTVLYVGSSQDPKHRFGDHSRNGYTRRHIRHLQYLHVGDYEQMILTEKTLIGLLKPKWNDSHC